MTVSDKDLNIRVGEAILERLPSANAVRSSDGTFELIEFIPEGSPYIYSFRAKKNGRFKFSAALSGTPLSAKDLLGLTEADYGRFISTGSPEKPEKESGETPPQKKSGRILIYRPLPGRFLLTDRARGEDTTLFDRKKVLGAALSLVKQTAPDAEVLFDVTLRVDVIGYFGGRYFSGGFDGSFFNGEDYGAQAESAVPAAACAKRIPLRVREHITDNLYLFLVQEPQDEAAAYLDDTINGRGHKQDIFPRSRIEAIWNGDTGLRQGLLDLAALSHYVNCWNEVEPRRWRFITATDLKKAADTLSKRLRLVKKTQKQTERHLETPAAVS